MIAHVSDNIILKITPRHQGWGAGVGVPAAGAILFFFRSQITLKNWNGFGVGAGIRRGLSRADILQTKEGEEGFFRCRHLHFLVQIKSRFFKIYGASAQTRRPIFRDFVQTTFMDDPLGS